MAVSKFSRWLSQADRALSRSSPFRRVFLRCEGLEDRVTPAIHTWIGPNNGSWSRSENWAGSSPPTAGEVGAQLVFNGTSFDSVDNIPGLVVDSIAFNANHGVLLSTPLFLNGGVGFAQIEATSTNVTFAGAAINLIGAASSEFNTGFSGNMFFLNNLGGAQGMNTIGSGTVTFRGAATYSGSTHVDRGVLVLDNAANADNTLPKFTTIVIGDGVGSSLTAELRLNSSNQIPDTCSIVIVRDGHLNLAGKSEGVGPLAMIGSKVTTGAGVLKLNGNVTATSDASTSSVLLGNINLGGANRTFSLARGSANRDLVINGVISGVGGVILDGGGTLEIAGAAGSPNSYSGDTTVRFGTLLLNADGTDEAIPRDLLIGDGSATVVSAEVRLLQDNQIDDSLQPNDVRIESDGRLELNGFTESIGGLFLLGGQVTMGAGSLHLHGSTGSSGSSTSTISGAVVLASSDANNLINTAIDSTLVINGSISGIKGLRKVGAGTLELRGFAATPNTFGGDTIVTEGTLVLNSGALNGAIPGDLIIGDGVGSTGSAGSAIVRLRQGDQIANSDDVIRVFSDGLLDLSGHFELTNGLVLGGGQVISGGPAGLLAVNGDISAVQASSTAIIFGRLSLASATRTFGVENGDAGVDLELRIDATIEDGGIIKNGPGRMILSGTNTYNGPTILEDGILEIDGFQPGSPVTVRGGTLGGSGTIGTLIGTGGVIDPGPEGTGIGSLSTSSVAFGTTTYAPDLKFALGLSLADVLIVQGSVDVTGASLIPNIVGGVFFSNEFVILANDGADPVIGKFVGLDEGAQLFANGVTLRITYRGGIGNNDVTLTVVTQARPLAVSGRPNGSAVIFAPGAAGQFGTPATLNPFGNLPANVRVATGDVNGDGTSDTILVTGPGTPIRFAVISGVDNTTLLIPVTAPFAGSEGFTGGGFVAAADLDDDDRSEIAITPDQGGGPRVTIFSLNPNGTLATRANFFGIDDPNFRGGARAAFGDLNHSGPADLLVAAGFGGGPRVALFDGATLLATRTKLGNDFFAFPEDAATLRNGIFAAIGDINGDHFGDLIFGGGPGGAPRVLILSGQLLTTNSPNLFSQPVANFFVAGNSNDRGGVRLAVENADGDAKVDLAVGSGEGSPANARVYLGRNFTSSGEPSVFQDIKLFGGAALTDGVFVG